MDYCLRPHPGVLLALAMATAVTGCINVGAPQDAQVPTSTANHVGNPDGQDEPSVGVPPQNGAQGSGTAGGPLAVAGGNNLAPTRPILGGTDGANGNNTSTEPVAEPIVPVSGMSRYTFVGRFDLTNPDAIPFTFLGSKVGVRFTGTSIAMDWSSTNVDGFNVVLDGNDMPPLMLKSSPATRVTVAQGLPIGTHTLWLTKRTEFNQGGLNIMNLSNMTLDEGETFMTPPAARPRRIEISGDSGQAGYGVDGLYIPGDPNHPNCGYATTNQNADHSIGGHLAQALNAEVVNLSWSGKGVVASQYSSDPTTMLPVIFEQRYPSDASRLWDFKVPMDVVILAGGANDFIGASGSGAMADPNKFIEVFSHWITRVRGHYPKALIVAAIGASAKQSDRTLLAQYLTSAVAQAQGPAGDSNIIFFDYFANDPNGWTTYGDVAAHGYNWGCNFHPSVTGSQWLSDRLAPVIRSHMGW